MDTSTTSDKAKLSFAVLGMALAVNSCSGIWDATIDPSIFRGDGQMASGEIDAPTESPDTVSG